MKVRELMEELSKINPETEVVLTINDDEDVASWELQYINLGWMPAGMVSLESGKCTFRY